MKLSDYVINFLVDKNIRHVFGVTGGAVCHLFDSIHLNDNITAIFNHHEQASGLAATAYSRITGNCGAAIVTTGPGGTNAVTGVAAAWMDSNPVMFISGQTRLAHTAYNNRAVRSLGTQELDIVSVVKPITQYAVMLDDPSHVRYEIEKAFYMAHEGRPGPVWIDIPQDLLWSDVDIENQAGFDRTPAMIMCSETDFNTCLDFLSSAERPLILAGNGIHLAGAENALRELAVKLNIPVVTSWSASDIFIDTMPNNLGRIGICGQKGANMAVKDADFMLIIGSHLNIPQTTPNSESFAPNAKKAMVNIAADQLDNCTINIDLALVADCKAFIEKMLTTTSSELNIGPWRQRCEGFKQLNSVDPELFGSQEPVNPYVFMATLSVELPENVTITIDGGGTNVYTSYLGLALKSGQRLSMSTTIAAMGTGLPESIGAAFAVDQMAICLTGDGSLQFNVQELQTIAHHNLNCKIFVFNNDGYLAIRNTQSVHMGSRFAGSSPTDVSLPDITTIGSAYGLKTFTITSQDQLGDSIRAVLQQPGPCLCEVITDPNEHLSP